jgi:hypothetical protein
MFKKIIVSLLASVLLMTGEAFADSTISALSAASGLSNSDLFVIVHSGSNYKLTASQLAGVVTDLASAQTISGAKTFAATITAQGINANAITASSLAATGNVSGNAVSGTTLSGTTITGTTVNAGTLNASTGTNLTGQTNLTNSVSTNSLINANGYAGRLLVDISGTGTTYIDGSSFIVRNFAGTNMMTMTTATGALSVTGTSKATSFIFPSYNNTTTSMIDGGGTNNFMRFYVNGSTVGSINGGGSVVWNYPMLATDVAGGSGTLAYVPPVYNHSGGVTSNYVHLIQDYGQGSGSTSITITLAGNAVFSNTQSYTCHVEDISSNTIPAVTHVSGTQFSFVLSASSDYYNYDCRGF